MGKPHFLKLSFVLPTPIRNLFKDFHIGQGCSRPVGGQAYVCAHSLGSSLLAFHNSTAVCGGWLLGRAQSKGNYSSISILTVGVDGHIVDVFLRTSL